MRRALALLVSWSLLGQDPAPVDRGCIGTWTLEVKNETGASTLTWSIHADGSHGSSARGPAALFEESSAVQARSGKWSVKAAGGRTDGGRASSPTRTRREPTFLAGLLARSRWGAARALRALQQVAVAKTYVRMFDHSLWINPITTRPGQKLPELKAFLKSIEK